MRRPFYVTRPSLFGSPLFLGFDHLEQMLDRVGKNADGYPPYNIEQIGDNRLRITLAVAGFSMDDLQITPEGIDVESAWLDNGLLHVELKRPLPEVRVKTIRIDTKTNGAATIVEGRPERG
jgi:HSP20 family molecular chaperone IbpA